eukprot:550372_1
MSMLLVLLSLHIHGILSIVTFSNSNNMYSCINGTGYSTSTLINLGAKNTLSECESAFSNYPNARSFIYYTPQYGDEDWRKLCYIRTDTYWSPVNETGIISGQIDNFYNCRSNLDCELNGVCTNSKCKCKPM